MKKIKGTYSICIGGYDWNCQTSKIILSLEGSLKELSIEDFYVQEVFQTVKEYKKTKDIVVSKEKRKLEKIYYSNENGHYVDGISQYISLELSVQPQYPTPLLYHPDILMNVWSNPYYFEITHPLLEIETCMTSLKSDADIFSYHSYQTKDSTLYPYAEFVCPQTDTLIVWLHGLGEGGTQNTDPRITVLANKVTALCSNDFQENIGGASILVPQCPTYWMDFDGRKFPDHLEDIKNRRPSMYLESLFEMIDDYKTKYNYKKIVLAGCSNGGYMTMLLALEHPTYFDTIIPICEALEDKYISIQQLKSIKDLPMFFIYSKDDKIVHPFVYEEPTIKRLKKIHATQLYVSTSEHVIDLSGVYRDEHNKPYQYNGHFSWIYFFNNQACCDDTNLSVWDFIKKSVKK